MVKVDTLTDRPRSCLDERPLEFSGGLSLYRPYTCDEIFMDLDGMPPFWTFFHFKNIENAGP
jgi:hypothetical protein